MIIKHFKYSIEGIVQGVGFRPFVYSLAHKYSLKGFVLNDSLGVKISLEGRGDNIIFFEKDLYDKLPSLARIDSIKKEVSTVQNFKSFSIVQSKNLNSKHSLVSSDFAMCKDCLNEMRDKKNRRFNYFFTNCTNCGPRYSIIKTVPYDRPNTSMKPFIMCEECQKEYDDPTNRRYHAQPISCEKCGPTLCLRDMNNKLISTNLDAIEDLANFIKNGYIVAMKGMGGFHIICDATNSSTIKSLRVKKNRPSKPFAVMVKSIEDIKLLCEVDDKEQTKICSNERPIVILKKKLNSKISHLVAPNIDRLGIFLPYTPLHVKLLDFLDIPIIATSANHAGEPIVTSMEDIKKKLGGVVEYYLDYNREIINSSDDSVLQIVNGKCLIMRASRGIAPLSIRCNFKDSKKILAVGAHQKNAIAIYLNNQLILSPFIGDLDNIETIKSFHKMLKTFKNFYNFEPDLIVCDKHPLYETTKWAKAQNKTLVQVQHHYAHVLSCMFEHDLNEQVLGVAWDGTGYGDDGTIWGGEFFVCDRFKYERVAYFEPFLLLGGDASIKDIRRIALSLIFDNKDNSIYNSFLSQFSKNDLMLLRKMHTKRLNSPKCSAVGRLFDMVAVIAGVCDRVSYDGESGLILESLYDENIEDSYDIYLDGKIIKYKHILKDMIVDNNPKIIASKFINALVKIVIEISDIYNLKTLLCGGVFQNRTLVAKILKRKQSILFQNRLPINDGSIAVGQIVKALST